MKEDRYQQESIKLVKAIDIGIEVLKKHPPKVLDSRSLIQIINTYLEYKDYALNPKPEFRSLASLKYVVNDFFTYYQESSGDDIEEFWIKIRENDLPYKRENKLNKILKRKKINNDIEYNFVKDVISPYRQEELITLDEVISLNKYLSDYENK